MKKLAILSEVPEREYLRNKLLAYALKKNGYEVKVIYTHFFPYLNLILYKPDLIISNGLRKEKDYYRFFQKMKKRYNTLFIVDYAEQLIDKPALLNYNNENINKAVDVHFCWGEKFYKELNNSYIKKNIFLTGSPRYDIAFLFKSIKKNNYKKFLGYLNSLYKLKDIDIDKKKNIVIVGNFTPQAIKKYGKEVINHFASLINRMIEEYSDSNFFYRPHPMENEKLLLNKVYFKNKIHVLKKYPINFIFSFSDINIFWQSTSSIEAHIQGGYNLFFNPTKNRNIDEFINEIFETKPKICYSQEEVMFYLDKKQNEKENESKLNRKLIYEKYGAYKRQIEIIKKLEKGNKSNFSYKKNIFYNSSLFWIAHETVKFFLDCFFHKNLIKIKYKELDVFFEDFIKKVIEIKD